MTTSAPNRSRSKTPPGWRQRRTASGAWAYYFEPTPQERAAGAVTARLPDERGAALRQCRVLKREARAALAAQAQARGSLAWLIERYRASPAFAALAPSSASQYRRILARFAAQAGDRRADRTTPKQISDFLRTVAGDAMRSQMRAVLTALFAWAIAEGQVPGLDSNPAAASARARPQPPRHDFWTVADLRAFLAAADELGLSGLGDMALAGLALGQRPGDLAALTWADLDGGMARLVQQKTGVAVAIPLARALDRRMAARAPRTGPAFPAANGLAYRRTALNDDFRRVLALAARRHPAMARLQFRDLRRSCVVLLSEAGATLPQIISVTGHSFASATRILDVYHVATAPQAHAAVTLLDAILDLDNIPTGQKAQHDRREERNHIEEHRRPVWPPAGTTDPHLAAIP